jgi:hypothetical protein
VRDTPSPRNGHSILQREVYARLQEVNPTALEKLALDLGLDETDVVTPACKLASLGSAETQTDTSSLQTI